MTLTAQEAFNHLDPQAWTQVSIAERLEILAARSSQHVKAVLLHVKA